MWSIYLSVQPSVDSLEGRFCVAMSQYYGCGYHPAQTPGLGRGGGGMLNSDMGWTKWGTHADKIMTPIKLLSERLIHGSCL